MARVMEGAEPFRMQGNEVGVLVSHGFTGTTQSVRPLGEALARANFTVAGPRLAGHGTRVKDLANSTADQWIASVREELEWLREHTRSIYFVGLSMGGTLALYFAAVHPDWLRGVIPINACVTLQEPELARQVFDPNAPSNLPGVGSDIKAPGVRELVYPEMPIPALKEFMALMRVTDDLLPAVEIPALIFQSTEDHVVPPENGPYIRDRIGSGIKELVPLENSYHVATLDNDAELIAERVVRFIMQY